MPINMRWQDENLGYNRRKLTIELEGSDLEDNDANSLVEQIQKFTKSVNEQVTVLGVAEDGLELWIWNEGYDGEALCIGTTDERDSDSENCIFNNEDYYHKIYIENNQLKIRKR